MSGPLPCNPDFWESALTQREGEMAVCQQFNQQELWSIAIGQERLRCSRSVFLSLAFLHRVSQCAARLRRAPAYSTTQYPTSDPSNSFLEPSLAFPTHIHPPAHTYTYCLSWLSKRTCSLTTHPSWCVLKRAWQAWINYHCCMSK